MRVCGGGGGIPFLRHVGIAKSAVGIPPLQTALGLVVSVLVGCLVRLHSWGRSITGVGMLVPSTKAQGAQGAIIPWVEAVVC